MSRTLTELQEFYFTTNKTLDQWGRVLHDPDLATAILDRVLERGRLIKTDGPSGRTRHLKLDQDFPRETDRARFPELRCQSFRNPQRVEHGSPLRC